jgi:hypothetical protein
MWFWQSRLDIFFAQLNHLFDLELPPVLALGGGEIRLQQTLVENALQLPVCALAASEIESTQV